MGTHLSQRRYSAVLSSLLQGPAAACCPYAQRMMAHGPQWYSQKKSQGFHTALAAAKRGSDGCRSLNWLALIRTRLHQESSYSAHVHSRKAPASERELPCCRSFAATSPFLPVLRPAMRYAQTASTSQISPSSSGDSLSSMDDSTDGSTPVASSSAEVADEWKLEYTGSLSGTIRTLKVCQHDACQLVQNHRHVPCVTTVVVCAVPLQVVSLTTATLSLIGSPLYILATMDGQYTAVKVMAASGFTCFGLFTTGMTLNTHVVIQLFCCLEYV